MPALPDNQVVVKFGADVPVDDQGRALLALEIFLREATGKRIEVFKEARGDDSKLRALMTPEQRQRL